ncbi:MAG: thioredoxin domain-containing protein [bacterium]|nr:thioredoxin domain-containing protein [bacterium]
MNINTKHISGFITVPMAIILGAIIIAIAVIYVSGPKDVAIDDRQVGTANVLDNLTPLTPTDHIWGNNGALIKIIEFSDTECPYCKQFHFTMKKIMEEYGPTGQVAWIYRHWPIDRHTKARKESQALECAAALGGNEKFWSYLDRLFTVTPSNDQLDLNELPNIAVYVGLNKYQFEECLNSSQYLDVIDRNSKEALKLGARGTPFSVLINSDGQKAVIDGAYPYSSIKQIVESLLITQ